MLKNLAHLICVNGDECSFFPPSNFSMQLCLNNNSVHDVWYSAAMHKASVMSFLFVILENQYVMRLKSVTKSMTTRRKFSHLTSTSNYLFKTNLRGWVTPCTIYYTLLTIIWAGAHHRLCSKILQTWFVSRWWRPHFFPHPTFSCDYLFKTDLRGWVTPCTIYYRLLTIMRDGPQHPVCSQIWRTWFVSRWWRPILFFPVWLFHALIS